MKQIAILDTLKEFGEYPENLSDHLRFYIDLIEGKKPKFSIYDLSHLEIIMVTKKYEITGLSEIEFYKKVMHEVDIAKTIYWCIPLTKELDYSQIIEYDPDISSRKLFMCMHSKKLSEEEFLDKVKIIKISTPWEFTVVLGIKSRNNIREYIVSKIFSILIQKKINDEPATIKKLCEDYVDNILKL